MDWVLPTPLAASTNCTPRVHRRDIILPNRLAHQLLLGEREMLARRRWSGHCGFVALAGTRLWAQAPQTRTNECQCKYCLKLESVFMGRNGSPRWKK